MTHARFSIVRSLILVFAAVFLRVIPCSVHAQATITVWSHGIAQEVAVSPYLDSRNDDWLELEFPAGAGRVRIHPSDYYVYCSEKLVGFKGRPGNLAVHRSVPKAEFEFKPAHGFTFIEAPEPPRAYSFMEWSSLFGPDTTAALFSALHWAAQITNAVFTATGFEVHVRTYMKHRGSLRFNNALELTEVLLEGEKIPVFRRMLPDASDDRWTSAIAVKPIESRNGEKIKVWSTFLQIGDNEPNLVAKAFLNGTEVTWLGAREPQWLLDQAKLIGVSARGTNGILFREAIPSSSMSGEFLTESNYEALERKYFGGEIIRLQTVAEHRGRSDSSSLHIRSVKTDGDTFKIEFSGAIDAREIPIIRYNRPQNAAIVTADGWESKAEVESF